MPWASYRRTPLGHHGFGRGLTHPGAGWVTRFWDRRLTPLADEFSSSAGGILALQRHETCSSCLGRMVWSLSWMIWMVGCEKSSFFFWGEKNEDSWDRPVSGQNVFPAEVGKTTCFF